MISKYQLFCIMLLSRLSSEVAFPQTGGFGFEGMASVLVAEAIRLVVALPVIIYSSKGRDIYGAAVRKNRLLGTLLGLTGAFAAAFLAARTVLIIAEFAQRTIITGMSAAVTAIIIALLAIYMAIKGAEALSRAGVLFLVAAGLVTVTVILADIPHMKLRDIGGAEISDSFIYQVLEQLLRGGEYLVFAALLPYVKKGGGGTALVFALASTVALLLVELFGMSVLGEFYGIAEYPFTAAAELADIAFFKRLDGFAAAVWTLGAAFRAGLLLFSVTAAVNSVMNGKEAVERSGT